MLMVEFREDKQLHEYLEGEKRSRRQRFRRGALLLCAGGAMCGFLATRMTDIGHATGFGGLGLLLVGGAMFLLFQNR